MNSRIGVVERDLSREQVINEVQNGAIRLMETGAARRDAKLDNLLAIVERMDRRLETYVRNGNGN